MIMHLLRCHTKCCAQRASRCQYPNRGILHSATYIKVAMTVTTLLLFMYGRPAVAQIPDGSCSDAVPVLSTTNELEFAGEGGDHFEVQHSADLALTEGTVSLFFTADNAYRRQGLFSKDASGYRDGGHLTALINDGRVEIRLQSTSQSVWIKTVSGTVSAGTEYHLAVTFGPDGFWAYVDGRMVGWHPEFDQDIAANQENLVIGANIWGRQESHPDSTSDPFDGRIRGFEIYGCQFDSQEVVDLSGHAPAPPPTDPYVMEGWLFGTDSDDILDASAHGVNNVDGSYGDDHVIGTDLSDVLDGGHGEDRLVGGEGDDFLYSSSDGREPVIAQNYGTEDDPDDEISLATRTYYPYQPIEADDVLVGGGGADTFHFRVLINAKPHIILKHVRNDGTINWGMGGVAGENNEVHDHWVDRLGDEVIEDFRRDEGDHIEVVGHTVEVYRRVHEDSDGDGILDCTTLYVRSNQGNGGGAHNKDLLGTIKVFGDLVMRSDYTVEQTDYGIYPTIYELEEAITPRVYTSVADDGTPPPYPVVNDGVLPPDGVFGMLQEVDFDGEDHIEVLHDEIFELSEGTFELRFTANDVARKQGLFSKDFTGNRDGGDITCFLTEGRVKVRLQSTTDSVYVYTHEGAVLPGQENHVAVTFGPGGLAIYLNGQIMDWEADFTQTLELNTQNMAIGANTWSRNENYPDYTRDHFVGQISDFIVYSRQYDRDEIAQLAGYTPESPPIDPYVMDGWLFGTDSNDLLDAGLYLVDMVDGGYGDDIVVGSSLADFLDGGHGEDRLIGGDGDDFLYSTSDGREPVIAQNYGPEDDPDYEISPTTRTYYAYQPIEADDVLIGGPGADTFHFRVLINAKPHIILKHVESDGTIDWGMGGVAGENNEVHDHWVDRLGDEVIEDFSRDEGDHIEVVGHTVEVYRRIYEDSDGDGILDCTTLHVRSNQGNGGGAHNKDLLGTIKVFGDLVMRSDYTVEQVDYGIYPTIYDLEEAVTPRVYTSVADDGTPPPYPTVDDGVLPPDGVFGMLHDVYFDGEDHIEVLHNEVFELPEGTFELRFTANDVARKQGLFSKDYTGNRIGGDITCFLSEGRVKVRLQSITDSEYAITHQGAVLPGQEYHLAVTFGPGGLAIYLNGQLMAWEAEFTQTLELNTQNMAIGANTWSRSEDYPDYTRDHFQGYLSDFIVYSRQYDREEIAQMAGYAPEPPPTDPYVMDGWLYGTDSDDVLNTTAYGVNNADGGYGDDTVVGSNLADYLDGGHGEDRLIGGNGDDFLYSTSDGREPVIAQNYGPEDDPDNEINPITRTYYEYQPIEADDVLVGGRGADTFHFRVLINAKPHIILKHVESDGTIDWGMGGVAGENNEVHDHWVDRLGDEVIEDFSREEGDQIEVVGHTVEVYRRIHEDSDGDGILDCTILYVRSNQGNGGGAHNKDLLGTIKVFGDLVMRSDYTVEQVDYGIYPTIYDLEEAVTPRVYTSVVDDGTPPPDPVVDDGVLPMDGVLGMLHDVVFDGEDHIEVLHRPSFELPEGTFALRFTADDVARKQGLFSKDFTGNREGGDITCFVYGGRIKVRLQNAFTGVYAMTPEGSVLPGQEYHLAVTFGPAGLWIYLNGQAMGWQPEFTQGLDVNRQNLAIGANTWSRSEDHPDYTRDHFAGRISEFMLFNHQYDQNEIAYLVDGTGTISTTTSSTSTSSTSSTSSTTDTSSTSTTSTSTTSSTTTSSTSSTTSTTTTSTTTVSDMLVLYYSFDEYDGGIVADYSGNGHTGSVAGATWTSAGVCGGAYRYDAGEYIYTRPSDDLDLRDNFTYMGWFKADTLAYDWNAICSRPQDVLNIGYSGVDSRLIVKTEADGSHEILAAEDTNVGEWNHFAVVMTNKTLSLFVNGLHQGSTNLTSMLPDHSANGITLGALMPHVAGAADGPVAPDGFDGIIDEFSVYGRAMSAREIREAYAMDYACRPTPDIKVNGFDGPLAITQSETLTLAVSLDPGGFAGHQADWWGIAETPFGMYHYDLYTHSWKPGLLPTLQVPLYNLESVEILTTGNLPLGEYTVLFGIDFLMNGIMDLDVVILDSVDVDVKE